MREALDDLEWLASHLHGRIRLRVGFDLADLSGYAYYSGARFAVYARGASDALVRGGRYDEVGAVFGRNRPAVGFSLDLKALVAGAPSRGRCAPRSARRGARTPRCARRCAACASRARPWSACCRVTNTKAQEFDCDRELVQVDGRWVLRALLSTTRRTFEGHR